MITILCDYCEADYSTCTCLAGLPDVLPASPLPLTSEADDFEFNPLDSWAHVDTSVETRDDRHPVCLVCGNDLDEWDSACDCDDDCAHAPWDFDDEEV